MTGAVQASRRAVAARLKRWAARRHGGDALPATVDRRRIYIVPTRFGAALALLLAAMLIAGLNYNSNLGLAFGFLMTSVALVAMHHCHRNLLGLAVDVNREAEAFAGTDARFDFRLRNDTGVARRDIEVHIEEAAAAIGDVAAIQFGLIGVDVPTTTRGLRHFPHFELRTRYPFGWFRAWTYVHAPLTAFVAPQARGDRPLSAAAAAPGSASRLESRGEEDFAGLRAYQPGIPLKHMAWKVLARGGEAAVRSYAGAAAQPQWLDWYTLGQLDPEARLAQLCRWMLECEAARRSYGLRLPALDIPPSSGATHRSTCLRALASFPPPFVAFPP